MAHNCVVEVSQGFFLIVIKSELFIFCWIWEYALVHLLVCVWTIFVNFRLVPVTNFLNLLGLCESRIEHALIITYEAHFSTESSSKMILRLTVNISTLVIRSSMRFSSLGMPVQLWVLSQIVIKCTFVGCWLIYRL